ncbi:capsid maturation protease [Streptomyces phage AxeJC]|uniref:Capsid maturation protease n=2 Tax=Ignaciovirus TaxID=3152509 RepID=A0A7D5JHK8_9CAUD|nr:capsid maturation protease [Streptomyces phage Eklok]YP_010756241.1 capsid maturation protease [Streptomyces phage AxeJC]QLF83191.1 capsid maturation protease [Streptomyces phage Eklok]URC17927.1 capsid maturation protease [Streptomyces phage AxeJC]
MPIHPGMVEDLAAGTRDLYADAEARLLRIIARQLAAGYDSPQWAERKLGAIAALRRASQAVVDQLDQAATLEIFDVVAEAYNTGHRAGVAELGALSDDARRLVDDITPQAQAVDRLAEQTVDRVTDTHRSILRTIVDRFRAVVAQVAALPLLGTATRREATQAAMQKWADEGITSFTDRSGRRWSLPAYAEMAVRTGVARAATEAHTRTLETAGVELVIVSNAPRECPLCRPWESQILTISGPDGARTVEVEHATDDDRLVSVRVAGSLDEARRAGLQHPNCRHSISAYTPGITRPPEHGGSDPEGYEAGQRQRAIERHIRRWKNRAAAATTPEAQRAANAKVRQWQGAMRNHLAAHPDLRRLRAREQPGASNLPTPSTAPPAPYVQAARVRSGDTGTMREMSDDEMGAAMRATSLDDRDRARIAAELDRRHPPDPLPAPAATGDAVEDLLADRAALDAATDPMPVPEEWGRLADDAKFADELAAAIKAAEKKTGEAEPVERVPRAKAREMYAEYVYRQYLDAEDACRGHLLSKRAQADGIDPMSLFSGPARIAHARASDELREWWRTHGRLTQAEFIEQATGQPSAAAAKARKHEADHQNKR